MKRGIWATGLREAGDGRAVERSFAAARNALGQKSASEMVACGRRRLATDPSSTTTHTEESFHVDHAFFWIKSISAHWLLGKSIPIVSMQIPDLMLDGGMETLRGLTFAATRYCAPSQLAPAPHSLPSRWSSLSVSSASFSRIDALLSRTTCLAFGAGAEG